ncbi:MAG: Hpr(Ser) kinase/phosphatase [Verrucomicrobiales bacterium]|nr:Hpr(Ser) kinase/phosphatase [Verrucomicrobiales bacterium]
MPPVLEYKYKLHGLVLSSWMPLPDASPTGPEDAAADIYFTQGQVPSTLEKPADEGACWQSAPGQVLVWVDGVARFLIEHGKSVTVEPCDTCSPETMSNLFFATPLAAVLLQRGLICFNASAIQKNGQTFLILGAHGSGKSTLAFELATRGYQFVSDEIVVLVKRQDGTYRAEPGIPVIKLWEHSIQLLGLDASSLEPLRPGVNKRKSLMPCHDTSDSRPVKKIFLLNEVVEDKLRLEEVNLIQKLPVLLEFVECGYLMKGMGIQRTVFKELGHVAAKVEVINILKSKYEFSLGALADAVEQRIGS